MQLVGREGEDRYKSLLRDDESGIKDRYGF